MVDNGICNDETNIAACNYDGGDCCGYNITSEHCTECTCFHQETCLAGLTHIFVGDGVCNDETNNAECNYDGDDCCGSCVYTEFCTQCACLGNFTGNGYPNYLLGNGICNDETNTLECGYDGFDCCGSNVDIDHCTECACHGKEIFINSCYYITVESILLNGRTGFGRVRTINFKLHCAI